MSRGRSSEYLNNCNCVFLIILLRQTGSEGHAEVITTEKWQCEVFFTLNGDSCVSNKRHKVIDERNAKEELDVSRCVSGCLCNSLKKSCNIWSDHVPCSWSIWFDKCPVCLNSANLVSFIVFDCSCHHINKPYCGSVSCHGALPHTARDDHRIWKHLYYFNTRT